MNNQKTHWDQLHEEGKADHYSEHPTDFAEEIIQLVPERLSILELGCGAGNDSNFFAEKGHKVLATDFSDIAIDKNRKRYAHKNLQFEVLDISKPLGFLDNTFDLVYARLSLHYFTDTTTKRIFKEINRVLKPNGFLCFICKSVKDPLYGKGREIEHDMFDDNGHIRHFFSEGYARECLDGYFKIDLLDSGEKVFYGRPSSYIKVIARKNS